MSKQKIKIGDKVYRFRVSNNDFYIVLDIYKATSRYTGRQYSFASLKPCPDCSPTAPKTDADIRHLKLAGAK